MHDTFSGTGIQADMADIFLSYSEKDRESARRVAETLGSVGWTVWWDRRIPAGQTWRDVLDQALAQMRCMIVLWTAKSIKSEWVYEEATEGRRQGKLVPVMLEAVRPPAGFREVQAADLTGWDGSREFEGMRSLIADLESRLGPSPIAGSHADPAPLAPKPRDPAPRRHGWAWLAGAMLIGAGLAYFAASYRRIDTVSQPAQQLVRPNYETRVRPPPAPAVLPPDVPVQETRVAPERDEKSSFSNEALRPIQRNVRDTPVRAERKPPSKSEPKSVVSATRPARRPATAARSISACSEFLAQIQAGQRLSEKAQMTFEKECK